MRAETHLTRQGYHCYLPLSSRERLIRGTRQCRQESLFPGYLFIQLDPTANWAPLRSTRGVIRLVGFGGVPLPVDAALINQLQQREKMPATALFKQGQNIRIRQGAFRDIDAIFMEMDGDSRVILLLNLLNRNQKIRLPLSDIACG